MKRASLLAFVLLLVMALTPAALADHLYDDWIQTGSPSGAAIVNSDGNATGNPDGHCQRLASDLYVEPLDVIANNGGAMGMGKPPIHGGHSCED